MVISYCSRRYLNGLEIIRIFSNNYIYYYNKYKMLIESQQRTKIGGLKKINKIGYKKLNNGKIVKSVEEQYLRQDVPCGVKQCPFCDKNTSK